MTDTTTPDSGIADIYDRLADTYDTRIPGTTVRDRMFAAAERRWLFDRIDAGDRVVDLAAGTGRIALQLAGRGVETVAVDASAKMLAVLARRAMDRRLHVELHQADIRQWVERVADGTADAVTCSLALMHVIPFERRSVFEEAARMLRRNGRLLVVVKAAPFERLSTRDRFAGIDDADTDAHELRFGGHHGMVAPWHPFTIADLRRDGLAAGLHMVGVTGLLPVAAWVPTRLLAVDRVRRLVERVERAVGDVSPFADLGYYYCAELVKGVR